MVQVKYLRGRQSESQKGQGKGVDDDVRASVAVRHKTLCDRCRA